LEPIVALRAQGRLESFARHILQATTAVAVQARPPQRLPITAPVTDAQPAVLPQFPRRAEATRRVDVSTEATSPDRLHSRRRLQDANLRKGLRRSPHQQPCFRLRLD